MDSLFIYSQGHTWHGSHVNVIWKNSTLGHYRGSIKIIDSSSFVLKIFFIGINVLAKKVVIATETSMNEGKKRRLGTIAKKDRLLSKNITTAFQKQN